jgi:D-alanyl-lipoteichoic acid acyltransferase DltB (MBOAT superfamily)
MVFNSLAFAAFLPIVLVLYHLAGRRHQNLLLLCAGYVFYGFWDVRFLYLVSVSTVLDYCTGLMIGKGRMTLAQRLAPSAHVIGFALVFLVPDYRAVRLGGPDGSAIEWARLLTPQPFGVNVLALTLVVVLLAHALYPRLSRLPEDRRRLLFLRASLVGQLGMLAVFKYYNFFVDSADVLAQRFGWSAESLHLHIVLPIGISFYTFQTLSYVIDVYHRRMEPVERLRDFALFVSYFPPLVAGPIERASHLVPRILGERKVTLDHFMLGAFLILLGLFKKVAIADGLAGSVNSVYGAGSGVAWLDVACATVAFALQIYCDFSGYSDIASGCSLFFGIDLLKNFDLPYFSVNPSEFWRRWHISLSTWLRDYLYIPLGGSRDGEARTYRNLMLTMVLGGLWHGAAWNFVLWGAYQGLLLVVHRAVMGAKAAAFSGGLLARLPRMAFFMIFVCYGWLLFRAGSFAQIAEFTTILLTGPFDSALSMQKPTTSALLGVPVLIALEAAQFTTRSVEYHRRLAPALRGGVYAVLTVLFLLGTSNEAQQFIYFQF